MPRAARLIFSCRAEHRDLRTTRGVEELVRSAEVIVGAQRVGWRRDIARHDERVELVLVHHGAQLLRGDQADEASVLVHDGNGCVA